MKVVLIKHDHLILLKRKEPDTPLTRSITVVTNVIGVFYIKTSHTVL